MLVSLLNKRKTGPTWKMSYAAQVTSCRDLREMELTGRASLGVRACVRLCVYHRQKAYGVQRLAAEPRNEHNAKRALCGCLVGTKKQKRKERNTHTRASYPTRAAVRTTPSPLHYKEGLGGVAHSV